MRASAVIIYRMRCISISALTRPRSPRRHSATPATARFSTLPEGEGAQDATLELKPLLSVNRTEWLLFSPMNRLTDQPINHSDQTQTIAALTSEYGYDDIIMVPRVRVSLLRLVAWLVLLPGTGAKAGGLRQVVLWVVRPWGVCT